MAVFPVDKQGYGGIMVTRNDLIAIGMGLLFLYSVLVLAAEVGKERQKTIQRAIDSGLVQNEKGYWVND